MATCNLTLPVCSAVSGVIATASAGSVSSARLTNSSFSHSQFFGKSCLSTASTSRPLPAVSRRAATECKINKGDKLPSTTLKDQDGKQVNLSKFMGKPLVLYFYPADETPGCTKQACAFRDSYDKFTKAGANVIGVSADSPESHKAFKQKYRLQFTLLSDENNKLRKDWGVPGDLFGTLPGRQTYVFDKNGVCQLIFNNQFQPEKHVGETLNVLKSI
ncbi:thioredoxin-dependent peroxiredoxin [Marchantia polymorpha subsp. ruderalis]|uniref:thioredoxin-dependent peroxiredoxin n=2 Tax=Marchantia polymorpha TaxID=3197 RepID=A0A176VZF9_MARPO|nr:hypothetical protein AXG93_4368s2330 [Marchantia polymorpha subsp. ruderalis]PTQ41763.1 hypothetical protein MARPO_0033s0151 [Marchantia polymorpha]BBM98646.1 hypothetical protein Mp_1g15100 [Marchantia polymorpha subsp. ruderalis]|eukprot:PTQ41763.1 hypothetical protein MARPO_0033s0151 [Marchantia polymorpha]